MYCRKDGTSIENGIGCYDEVLIYLKFFPKMYIMV